MPQNNNVINLQNLILSRIEEAKRIKKNNQQKDEAFQAYTKEIRNRISNIEDQFNDI